MNGEDLFRALNQVDERYIQEAETDILPKPKYLWIRWAVAAAACLAVVVAAGFAGNLDSKEKITMDGMSMEQQNAPAGIPETAACPEYIQEVESPNDSIAATDGIRPELTVPAETVISDNAPDEESGIVQEVPSILVRIDEWTDLGFRATVEEIVDTDIFPVGRNLTVLFEDHIRIVETNGETVSCALRRPTEEDFPKGSVVQVMFRVLEESVICVEQIGWEDAF